jgi:hypothetical protein
VKSASQPNELSEVVMSYKRRQPILSCCGKTLPLQQIKTKEAYDPEKKTIAL